MASPIWVFAATPSVFASLAMPRSPSCMQNKFMSVTTAAAWSSAVSTALLLTPLVHLDAVVVTDKYVGRFDVAVQNFVGVQHIQAQADLCMTIRSSQVNAG
jgi:hypothetical protein